MGVDLRLLPFYSLESEFSLCVLQLEKRSSLWPSLEKIEKKYGLPVSNDFNSFCSYNSEGKSPCYGKTTMTPYGIKIKWVYAKYLKTLNNRKEVQDNYMNQASWSYLLACPDKLKIALYWH